jgi:hypothetical protein
MVPQGRRALLEGDYQTSLSCLLQCGTSFYSWPTKQVIKGRIMDLNACYEPTDDTNRKVALIFYVENVQQYNLPTYLPLSIACSSLARYFYSYLRNIQMHHQLCT